MFPNHRDEERVYHSVPVSHEDSIRLALTQQSPQTAAVMKALRATTTGIINQVSSEFIHPGPLQTVPKSVFGLRFKSSQSDQLRHDARDCILRKDRLGSCYEAAPVKIIACEVRLRKLKTRALQRSSFSKFHPGMTKRQAFQDACLCYSQQGPQLH